MKPTISPMSRPVSPKGQSTSLAPASSSVPRSRPLPPPNPDVQFTLIDAPSSAPNVAGTEFQTDEAAFAAGYLAAGMTQTGIVATYGGVNIPTVSIFMDGYARGVAHYNEVNGADCAGPGMGSSGSRGGGHDWCLRPGRPDRALHL